MGRPAAPRTGQYSTRRCGPARSASDRSVLIHTLVWAGQKRLGQVSTPHVGVGRPEAPRTGQYSTRRCGPARSASDRSVLHTSVWAGQKRLGQVSTPHVGVGRPEAPRTGQYSSTRRCGPARSASDRSVLIHTLVWACQKRLGQVSTHPHVGVGRPEAPRTGQYSSTRWCGPASSASDRSVLIHTSVWAGQKRLGQVSTHPHVGVGLPEAPRTGQYSSTRWCGPARSASDRSVLIHTSVWAGQKRLGQVSTHPHVGVGRPEAPRTGQYSSTRWCGPARSASDRSVLIHTSVWAGQKRLGQVSTHPHVGVGRPEAPRTGQYSSTRWCGPARSASDRSVLIHTLVWAGQKRLGQVSTHPHVGVGRPEAPRTGQYSSTRRCGPARSASDRSVLIHTLVWAGQKRLGQVSTHPHVGVGRPEAPRTGQYSTRRCGPARSASDRSVLHTSVWAGQKRLGQVSTPHVGVGRPEAPRTGQYSSTRWCGPARSASDRSVLIHTSVWAGQKRLGQVSTHPHVGVGLPEAPRTGQYSSTRWCGPASSASDRSVLIHTSVWAGQKRLGQVSTPHVGVGRPEAPRTGQYSSTRWCGPARSASDRSVLIHTSVWAGQKRLGQVSTHPHVGVGLPEAPRTGQYSSTRWCGPARSASDRSVLIHTSVWAGQKRLGQVSTHPHVGVGLPEAPRTGQYSSTRRCGPARSASDRSVLIHTSVWAGQKRLGQVSTHPHVGVGLPEAPRTGQYSSTRWCGPARSASDRSVLIHTSVWAGQKRLGQVSTHPHVAVGLPEAPRTGQYSSTRRCGPASSASDRSVLIHTLVWAGQKRLGQVSTHPHVGVGRPEAPRTGQYSSTRRCGPARSASDRSVLIHTSVWAGQKRLGQVSTHPHVGVGRPEAPRTGQYSSTRRCGPARSASDRSVLIHTSVWAGQKRLGQVSTHPHVGVGRPEAPRTGQYTTAHTRHSNRITNYPFQSSNYKISRICLNLR